jgi:hypothetical protein
MKKLYALLIPAITCTSISFAAAPSAEPGKTQAAMNDIVQLNTSMFGIYEKSLGLYQKDFKHPLIMALFSGKGGRFILYRPGQPPLEAPPVPPIYEIVKSAGHCAMGTYTMVRPYMADAKADQEWVTDMKAYRITVQTAMDNIPNLDIKPDEKTLVSNVLTKVVAFMDSCLKNGTFTSTDVQAYTRGVEPDCEKLITIASAAQVGHWFEVLTEWEKLLGPDWDQTYALSNSIYVTRQNNILFSVLVQFMGENAINDRVIMLETTDFQTTPEAMMGSFMRIVSDRELGRYFFNNNRMMDYELLGFGGRNAIETEMVKLGRKAVLPPLVPFNSTEWPWKNDPSKGSGPKSFDDLHDMGLLKP